MNHLTSFTAGPLSIGVYGKRDAESIIYIPQPEPVTEEVYFLTDEFPGGCQEFCVFRLTNRI